MLKPHHHSTHVIRLDDMGDPRNLCRPHEGRARADHGGGGIEQHLVQVEEGGDIGGVPDASSDQGELDADHL